MRFGWKRGGVSRVVIISAFTVKLDTGDVMKAKKGELIVTLPSLTTNISIVLPNNGESDRPLGPMAP